MARKKTMTDVLNEGGSVAPLKQPKPVVSATKSLAPGGIPRNVLRQTGSKKLVEDYDKAHGGTVSKALGRNKYAK